MIDPAARRAPGPAVAPGPPGPADGLPRITAAICTFNDAGVITAAIESVLDQSMDPNRYEILVVNNASTDGTDAILADLAAQAGSRLRVIEERTAGLSAARNRALDEAAAPIVAFIDADALADRRWLQGLLEIFDRSDRVAVVGGAVNIRWDHPRPAWWDERMAEAMNAFHPAATPRPLSYPRYPYGTNLALRRAAAVASGGFSPHLGRKGRSLAAAEEGELCLRLEREGWMIYYTPAAVVDHRTAADRLTRRYILRRAFSHGRSQFLLESLHGLRSGHYLSWGRIARVVAWRAARRQCDLPFLKYILFRIGYHAQRSFLGSAGA